jgi:hypothetical protein
MPTATTNNQDTHSRTIVTGFVGSITAALKRKSTYRIPPRTNLEASCGILFRSRKNVNTSIVPAVAATEYAIISSQKNGSDEAESQASHPGKGVEAVGPRAENANPVSQIIRANQPKPKTGRKTHTDAKML